jgi:hypothetical protein
VVCATVERRIVEVLLRFDTAESRIVEVLLWCVILMRARLIWCVNSCEILYTGGGL